MTDRAADDLGANSGIGLATVVEVAKRGFRSIGSVRSPKKAEVVHAAATDAGVEVETILLDVTDAEQCENTRRAPVGRPRPLRARQQRRLRPDGSRRGCR